MSVTEIILVVVDAMVTPERESGSVHIDVPSAMTGVSIFEQDQMVGSTRG